MATIKFRRGAKATMPTLAQGEPAYTTDESKVYIGSGTKNIELARAEDVQTQLNAKADASHGTHVTYSTAAPKVAGTASAGSASTVSRSDHVHPAQTSVSGNAGTADKLKTTRSIALGTGVAGTATNFDGSTNITIPVTSIKESYLSWGGKDLASSVSPIGVAMSSVHNANRLAFLNPDALSFETSTDGGSTWSPLTVDDEKKTRLTTLFNTSINVGTGSTATTNLRTRLTIRAQSYVYFGPKKLLIRVSSPHGMNVKLEYKTGQTDASWVEMKTCTLGGWSGWNEIDVSSMYTLGGGSNQYSNKWYLRLTFGTTSIGNASYTSTLSQVMGIAMFGGNCWSKASTLGETGHLYEIDWQKNATFPAAVSAAELKEGSTRVALQGHTHNYAGSSSAGGAATSANKLNTNAGDANTPVYFTNGVPVACTSLDLNTTGSSASCTGNSATATKLKTARTISLTGGVTGSGSFDGSANLSISATVGDIDCGTF